MIGLMRSLCGTHETTFSKNKVRVNCVAPFMTGKFSLIGITSPVTNRNRPESGFITPEMRVQLEKVEMPINKASSVAKAMVYMAVNEDVKGQTIYVADNEFTELEGPIRALRPQWLGEKNSALLAPVTNSGMMTAGHIKD
jgi:hypothetical protein